MLNSTSELVDDKAEKYVRNDEFDRHGIPLFDEWYTSKRRSTLSSLLPGLDDDDEDEGRHETKN